MKSARFCVVTGFLLMLHKTPNQPQPISPLNACSRRYQLRDGEVELDDSAFGRAVMNSATASHLTQELTRLETNPIPCVESVKVRRPSTRLLALGCRCPQNGWGNLTLAPAPCLHRKSGRVGYGAERPNKCFSFSEPYPAQTYCLLCQASFCLNLFVSASCCCQFTCRGICRVHRCRRGLHVQAAPNSAC